MENIRSTNGKRVRSIPLQYLHSFTGNFLNDFLLAKARLTKSENCINRRHLVLITKVSPRSHFFVSHRPLFVPLTRNRRVIVIIKRYHAQNGQIMTGKITGTFT